MGSITLVGSSRTDDGVIRSYDSFPVNSFQAESRRMSRVSAMGHTPGVMHVPPATINLAGSKEFPFMRDFLRG